MVYTLQREDVKAEILLKQILLTTQLEPEERFIELNISIIDV